MDETVCALILEANKINIQMPPSNTINIVPSQQQSPVVEEHDTEKTLSTEALLALHEVLDNPIYSNTTENMSTDPAVVTKEDWSLSQFWYDGRTSALVSREAVTAAKRYKEKSSKKQESPLRIAFVSCPSGFKGLWAQRNDDNDLHEAAKYAILFEIDARFSCFGDQFVCYDYNHALDIPREFHHAFDCVVFDPPYLNDDCQSEYAKTVRLLQRAEDTPVMLLTGAIMADHAKKTLGLLPSSLEITHSNQLNNPYKLFVNYQAKHLETTESLCDPQN